MPWRVISQCAAASRRDSTVTDMTFAGSRGRRCSTFAPEGQPAAPTATWSTRSSCAQRSTPGVGSGRVSRQLALLSTRPAVAPRPPSSSASSAVVTRTRASRRDAVKRATTRSTGLPGVTS